MSRRILLGATALACGVFLLSCAFVGLQGTTASFAADKEPSGKEAPANDVFGPAKVWSIHLNISAKEYQALQPSGGGFGFPGAPPAPPAPKDPKEKRASERNLFGTEF